MRVAIGGFTHETNTFHPRPTTLAAFQGPEGTWLHGDAIVAAFGGTRSVLGGMLDVGRERGWQMTPTFFANHPPITGLIDAEAFDAIRDNLVPAVAAAGADAVLLHLHGAGAAANAPDPEAVVLRDIRAAVGPSAPIVVVYDLHANISPEWWQHANAIIGYKTAPHVDFYERGAEGAALLDRILRREVTPVVTGAKPPVMIKAGLMSMTSAPLALIKPPMYWLMQRAAEMERHAAVLNVSVAAGFGDADTPATGMTLLVNTDGDRALAEEYAAELADLAWRLRRGLDTDLVMTPVTTAIERALNAPVGPVILADQGNNTAGGSPGDGTAILAGLRDAGWPDAVLCLRDEAAVDTAWAAGPGREIEVAVGGKNEPLNGEPVTLRGTVRLITTGETRHVVGGPLARMGRVAVVRCGQTDIVLTQYATSQTHPGYFRVAGIEPRERHIVVVQSAHLFREAFEVQERIPRMIIEVDSPGITSPNARRFTYQHVRRPIYPLDDFAWTR
ncbi:MAG: M81 family metallopeptidase [Chloroflexi bacterium]|nr:M81 family metallopeptidase [Chloroflexota bacterium]